MLYELIYTITIIAFMILVFYAIISRFGHSSDKQEEKPEDTNEPISYIPKRFLSNYEYNFLTKFIDKLI